uniref:Transmembrane protein 53 n=1 Tax=Panthera leo TaxID=9689 RepID=A0A8C9D586_PANLE
MASSELDYTIEIPDQPCWSQENSPNQGGKEVGTRQPLVILLGWGGCTDKNLAKYSAIYHKRVSTAGLRTPSPLGRCPLWPLCGELSLGRPHPWAAVWQAWEWHEEQPVRKMLGSWAFWQDYPFLMLPALLPGLSPLAP